jgi:NAD(P)-dependent dehydrogenase (short-subunit alcohol dehydrogenase family)
MITNETRTALVVGTTGGIGEACARRLHAAGYALLLNARRSEPLRELAEELDADYVACDGNDEEHIRHLVGRAANGIDVVVHAAGILKGSAAREQSVQTFDEVITANLRSVYVVVHAALPAVNVGGRIILVSSTTATRPMRGLTAYSAAKAGMNAMAEALAAEVETDGINVSLVSPGPISTPMMDQSVNAFSSLPADDVGGVVAWLAALPPRMVVPDILFRAPHRGPFAEMAGGGGSAGQSIAEARAAKAVRT